jgi:hypothetical protein
MSSTLSVPPPTGFGAFRDITPGGIPRKREDATWAAVSHEGTLHLAALGRQTQSVQRFVAGKWETLYQRTLRGRGKADTEGDLPAAQFAPGTYHNAPALYLRISNGDETEYLRSTGGAFEVVLPHAEDVTAAFADSAVSPTLREVPPTSQFSRVVPLGKTSAAAFHDPVLGCSLWIQGETWQPAFIRGAHRFSDNAEVLAADTFNDHLFLVLGKSGPPAPGKKVPGFEVVRVYADGSWDLIIGTPRISNQGLKVPLACLAPGLHDFEPSRFCFFTAGLNHLLLGTYDDLAGFRIWRSTDGTEWIAGEAELVGLERVRAAEPLRLAGGAALILDLESPQHGQTRAVWAGE